MSERNQYISVQNSTNGSHERPVFLTPKIVITGGPCSGKTTAIETIGQYRDILAVPEAATILLGGGFPAVGKDRPYTPQWQRSLQKAVIATQQGIEEVADNEAHAYTAVLLDRGMVDNVAYLPGGIAEYEEMAQEDITASYGRYKAVIHLGSFAKLGTYQTENNQARFEDPEEAIRIDDRLREVWAGHPKVFYIDNPNERATIAGILAQNIIAGKI